MRWRSFVFFGCLLTLVATALWAFTMGRSRFRRVHISTATSTNLFRVITLTGNAFVNADGAMVIPPRPWVISAFSDGMALSQVRSKYGYIDLTGKLAIPAIYKMGTDFQDGHAIVWDELGPLVISRSNTVVRRLNQVCDDIRQFSEGLAAAEKSGKWGFVNTNFVFEIPPQFSEVNDFRDGFAGVKVDNAWGAISYSGRIIVTPRFDVPLSFSEGRARVRLNGKMGYVGTNDEMLIQPHFDDAGDFRSGLAPAKERDHWGYIDERGDFLIKPRFSLAYEFSEGLAAVQFHLKFGFIDPRGEFIVAPKYDTANPFEHGLAWVERDGFLMMPEGAYIRTNGMQVWPRK